MNDTPQNTNPNKNPQKPRTKKRSYAGRPTRSERNKRKRTYENEEELKAAKVEYVPFNEHYIARIVHPYVYTYRTYAKRRWTLDSKSILDVYSAEFGSYPKVSSYVCVCMYVCVFCRCVW